MIARHVRRVVLCLVLGLVTTVAVAWGCAIWTPLKDQGDVTANAPPWETRRAALPPWLRQSPSGEHLEHYVIGLRAGLGLEVFFVLGWEQTGEYVGFDQTQRQRSACVFMAGWPLRAMSCVGEIASSSAWPPPLSDLAGAESGLRDGLVAPRWMGPAEIPSPSYWWVTRSIPFNPVWLGFAANTGFYSFACWLAFVAPGGARRVLRRLRGLCPSCGYSLTGLPAGSACPECGPQPS